jgi:hypothetical protein
MTDEGTRIYNEITVFFKDSWTEVTDLKRNSD